MIRIKKDHKAYAASVRCNRCHASGGTMLNLALPYAVKEDVEKETILRWNRRAEYRK